MNNLLIAWSALQLAGFALAAIAAFKGEDARFAGAKLIYRS